MPARWCCAAPTSTPFPTIRTISRRICKRWPDPPPAPTADPFSSMDSAAANCRPRNRSARSASIRIRSRRSTTSWATARSRSSPSPAPTNIAAPLSGTSPTISGTRAIPIRPRRRYFLLNEFEGNAGGPLSKKSSFTLDAQRNMVDNGSITNAVTLNPQTLAIQPFAGVLVTPGRYTNVSPRVDYQLSENNTLMFRYGITHSDVQDNGIGGFDLASRGYHYAVHQPDRAGGRHRRDRTPRSTKRAFSITAAPPRRSPTAPAPLIQVLQSFNGGGANVGRRSTRRTATSFRTTRPLSKARTPGVSASACAARRTTAFRRRISTAPSPLPAARWRRCWTRRISPCSIPGPAEIGADHFHRTLSAHAAVRAARYSPAQIRALGGGATQFSISTRASPDLAVHQVDAGHLRGDEWRVRPNLTLNLGLRYETQSNIHDWRDIAPRVAFAWAPGGSGGKARRRPCCAADSAFFTTAFRSANTLAAERYNGVVQQQYVVDQSGFLSQPSAARRRWPASSPRR